jgi:L-iditol 2-dehydrogenase
MAGTSAFSEPSLQADTVPNRMRAAVYRGPQKVVLERLPVPEICDSEILVRVHTCGVCGTDLKKIELGLVAPPRVFGHEIAGTVVRTGNNVTGFRTGDRVIVQHHVPCRRCFYCGKKLFSQCEFYRKTGTTAGFEPAGGGFAEYVRVMDWIVGGDGVVLIPDDITFEEAAFLEPLNTCVKALETAALQRGEVVVILGQGPVGLLLAQAACCYGATVVGLDFMQTRLEVARELRISAALHPGRDDVDSVLAKMTDGRGADLAIVATADHRAVADAQAHVRRGGRVLLFAQTVPGEKIPVDASCVCIQEKQLIGSYSSSIELQDKSAKMIFERQVNVARLVTHRFALELLPEAIELASHPSEDSLKVMIQP